MVLEPEGYGVEEAGSAEEALGRLAGGGIDAVLLDVKLPGMSGLDALAQVRVPTVMISGHATLSDAVRATKLGAFDFLEKPLDRARVLVTLRNALEQGALRREIGALKARLGDGELIGRSDALRTLLQQIAKAAPTRGRILISG